MSNDNVSKENNLNYNLNDIEVFFKKVVTLNYSELENLFDRNTAELEKLLFGPTKPQNYEENIELDKPDQASEKFSRLLYNYVTSVISYLDYIDKYCRCVKSNKIDEELLQHFKDEEFEKGQE